MENRTPTADLGSSPEKKSSFIESMEEEMRRSAAHMERRSRRNNSFKGGRGTEGLVMNGFDEAGARKRRINTFPRAFTLPMNNVDGLHSSDEDGERGELGDVLSPLGGAPGGALLGDVPADCETKQNGFYRAVSSESGGGSSSRESSVPLDHCSSSVESLSSPHQHQRRRGHTPRSSASPPPVAAKPKRTTPTGVVSPYRNSSPRVNNSMRASSAPPPDTTTTTKPAPQKECISQQSHNKASAAGLETKSIPVKSFSNRHNRSHLIKQRGGEQTQESHSKQASNIRPSKSESKIHITVSSTVDLSRIADQDKTGEKTLPVPTEMETKASLQLVVKDLQAQLREKSEAFDEMQQQNEKIVYEKDEEIKRLVKESHKMEREKWELLKRARDAAERALHLRTQLDTKDTTLRSFQSELEHKRAELTSVKSANTSLRALINDLRTHSKPSTVDVAVQAEMIGGSLRRNRSMELAFTQGGLSQEQEVAPFDRSSVRLSSSTMGEPWGERAGWEKEAESSSLFEEGREQSSSSLPLGSVSQPDGPTTSGSGRRSGRRLKKPAIFGKMKRSSGKRGSISSVDGLELPGSSSIVHGSSRGATPISAPYQSVAPETREHWRILEEAKSVPFSQWSIRTIVAWLEAGIGMSQYTAAVRERVTSGHALLALSDADMEKKLGMALPLHRRKLKLAIHEQHSPQSCQFPEAGKIDHSWVAFEWASDCGLGHLTETLVCNLVDGRLLNSLSRDDLKRYLKVTKKLDQLSFLAGVELLRMHDFNRQAIQEHRRTSRNPLYWTNRDVCEWLKSVQLTTYAHNVIGRSVHGALLFLERGSFTADQLASILQVPMSKTHHRKLLANKMAALFSEDIDDSLEPIAPPSLSSLSRSPDRRVGSPDYRKGSPDRRHRSPDQRHGSPDHGGVRSPSVNSMDCPHPTRKNSLIRNSQPALHTFTAMPPSYNLTPPTRPPAFQRTGSHPALSSEKIKDDTAERLRMSLRESALRSVQVSSPTHRADSPLRAQQRGGTPTHRAESPRLSLPGHAPHIARGDSPIIQRCLTPSMLSSTTV